MFAETAPGADERRFKAMFEGTNIEREILVTDEILRGFAGPTLYQPPDVTGTGNIASGAASGAVGGAVWRRWVPCAAGGAVRPPVGARPGRSPAQSSRPTTHTTVAP